jgi:hypothetical protein
VQSTGVWNFKWFDAIKYITVANTFGTSGYFDIKLSFNSMPKDIQQILLKSANGLKLNSTFMNQFAKDSLTELRRLAHHICPKQRAKFLIK